MRPDATKIVTKQDPTSMNETSRRDLDVVNGELVDVHPKRGDVQVRLPRYTLETAFASVPPLPDRDTGDFDDLIDEAMEDHAAWVVDRMRRGLE